MRHRYPGWLPADDRAALRGIGYVLCKGVSWRDVPAQRTGYGGVTAWRRLRTGQRLVPCLHYEVCADLHLGLLQLVCIICLR